MLALSISRYAATLALSEIALSDGKLWRTIGREARGT
jgi:hypothetical protein